MDKKVKKEMLEEKEELYKRYEITEKYLIERIEVSEETDRRPDLKTVQHRLDELEKLINFLKE